MQTLLQWDETEHISDVLKLKIMYIVISLDHWHYIGSTGDHELRICLVCCSILEEHLHRLRPTVLANSMDSCFLWVMNQEYAGSKCHSDKWRKQIHEPVESRLLHWRHTGVPQEQVARALQKAHMHESAGLPKCSFSKILKCAHLIEYKHI